MSNQPVTEPQKFAGDIFWMAASNLAVPLVGLITLPAMTKNYSAETYVVWVQSFIIVGLVGLIIGLYLGHAVVRFLAAEDNMEIRRRAMGAMLWPVLAFTGLALVISLLLRQDLSKLLFATPDYAHLDGKDRTFVGKGSRKPSRQVGGKFIIPIPRPKIIWNTLS